MFEENIVQEFKLKNIDETRNYFITEINQNGFMIKKHKNVCRVLNYLTLTYCSFCYYWMCFHFCFCFFSWYSCRHKKFCNRIRNLCNNWKN